MNRIIPRGSAVVVNATNIGQYLDGIGICTLNLIRQIVSTDTGLRFIIYVNKAAEMHLRAMKTPDHCSFRWVTAQVSPDHGFRGHLLRLLLSNWIGIRHFRSTIFVTSQLEAIFFRARQMIMIHDVIPMLFRSCHKKQYFYFRWMLPLVLRRSRAIVTPSNHTKELIEQIYGIPSGKIRVVHNGVRLPPAPADVASLQKQTPFILYTGRIVRMKNITGVLKSFAMIQDRVPHRIVITGHGREHTVREFEQEKLKEYGIPRERVLFSGHVSLEEMAVLLRQADLLVFPSFYEGFGLPPLEAMAAGCPVVVSHAGSLPEVCGEAAYYVDPYDTENIAEGMFRVLSDSTLREAMIGKGLERAGQFSWERTFMQLGVQLALLNSRSSTAESHTSTQPVVSS